MLKTRCTACGNRFSDREALCEDWRDPERSFACPSCNTYFYRDVKSAGKIVLSVGLFSGGVAVPLIFLLNHSLRTADTYAAFLSGVVLLSSVILWVLNTRNLDIERKPVSTA